MPTIDQKIDELARMMANILTELKQDISDVRDELKQDISDVRSELKEDLTRLKGDMQVMFDQHIGVVREDTDSLASRVKVLEELNAR